MGAAGARGAAVEYSAPASGDVGASGESVTDELLDGRLPDDLRRVSWRFWTPVSVARLAARWLERAGARRVLDVGAGAGKFCVAGALCSELAFHGVEQRPRLVAVARALARSFGTARRARVELGTVHDVDPSAFDGLYMFNPFEENEFDASEQLDQAVELSAARRQRDLWATERLLWGAPVGTALVTYNGYGGRVPDQYLLERCQQVDGNMLRLWRKRRARGEGGYWLELEETVIYRRTHPGG